MNKKNALNDEEQFDEFDELTLKHLISNDVRFRSPNRNAKRRLNKKSMQAIHSEYY